MKVEHNEEDKRFTLETDQGEGVGEIEYIVDGDGDLYATHTEVYPAYEGNGYAAILLDALVDYAKKEHAKVVPLCGYVISSFKKYPDKYSEVFK